MVIATHRDRREAFRLTKRHLSVRISIPGGGKHAGAVDYAIDPDKVTADDREWAAGLIVQIAEHLGRRRFRPDAEKPERGDR